MFKLQIPEVTSTPNVVPMADIMLVLLIIFMVVTPMLQKGVSVEMARVENTRQMPDADKEDAVVIAVTRTGNIFIGNEQVTLEDITSKVRESLEARLDKTVYVKSDARAMYGDVVKVVDEVRAAGVDQLGLLTEQVETRRPGAPSAPPGG
jgi:biopolymer transport protein ExbD/biopolymer transport protein TolR